MQPPPFNVFLSHNAKDKEKVRQLKTHLEKRGLKVWFDEEELRPGIPWQDLLEQGILGSTSVAVLIGKDGLGPWEEEEMRLALRKAVSEKRAVIPVLLPGTLTRPELPPFLGNRTWVNLAEGFTKSSLDKLCWGITGIKPAAAALPPAGHELQESSSRRFTVTLNCASQGGAQTHLHWRPCGLIARFCLSFPNTEFLFRKHETPDAVSGKSIFDMVSAQFCHEDVLEIEVSGESEIMASACLKVICENLQDYGNDEERGKNHLNGLVLETMNETFDPEFIHSHDSIYLLTQFATKSDRTQARGVAVINDRLHDISLFAIPMVAKHHRSNIRLQFDSVDSGIFTFEILAANDFCLDPGLIEVVIPPGTRITITADGDKGGEAVKALTLILENLWQCDDWLRRKHSRLNRPEIVRDLIAHANEVSKLQIKANKYVNNPYISELLTKQCIAFESPGMAKNKAGVFSQMAGIHSRLHGLDEAQLLKAVSEPERPQSVELRHGFALLHTAVSFGPRLSLSFGIYPTGINWEGFEQPVKLVAMVVFSHDTYRTWRECMKKFAVLFREVPSLLPRLIACQTANDFLVTFREAERNRILMKTQADIGQQQ
jgi:phosphotransferase system HPr-like phosphotransfer protein/mannitol/fructose-specific phosphotransferase system IIA component (Ntr-type)